MIRRLLLASLVLSICTFSSFAADDDPKKEEKKGPKGGFGTAADPEARFKKLDADSDSKVTKEEFRKALSGFGGGFGKAKGGEGKGGEFTDRLFDRMDADKDGKITLDEYKKAQANIVGGFGGANGKIDPEKLKQLKDRFKKKNDN